MQAACVLTTPRLRVHLATADVLAAAMRSPEELSAHLDAAISPAWLEAGLPLLHVAGSGLRARTVSRAVVVHARDRMVIGDIRCERAKEEEPTYELGYAIVPAYRRQGLAVEAAQRIVDWLFEDEGATLIRAGCNMRNRASVRTLRKLGFWLDGAAGRAFWWRLTPEILADYRAAQTR